MIRMSDCIFTCTGLGVPDSGKDTGTPYSICGEGVWTWATGTGWLELGSCGDWSCCIPIMANAATDAATASPAIGFRYIDDDVDGESMVGSDCIASDIFLLSVIS